MNQLMMSKMIINELIPVGYNEKVEKLAVLGSILYDFLEIPGGYEYTTWIKRKIKRYGFIIEKDYIEHFHKRKSWEGNREVTRKIKDYILTLDMAKQLCMLAEGHQGEAARLYFIECEEKLREMQLPSYQIMDPARRARKWAEEYEEHTEEIKHVKKVSNGRSGGYARSRNHYKRKCEELEKELNKDRD